MPADGYYEWKPVAGKKQLYFIHTDQPFAFAGLWEHWEGEEAESFDSYTIITGPVAEAVRDIHAPMPLILPKSVWLEWMESETPSKRLKEILSEPVSELESYPISTRVNNPRNEGPGLIKPLLLLQGPVLNILTHANSSPCHVYKSFCEEYGVVDHNNVPSGRRGTHRLRHDGGSSFPV